MKIKLINSAAGQIKIPPIRIDGTAFAYFSHFSFCVGMSTCNTAGPDARETVSLRVEAAHHR